MYIFLDIDGVLLKDDEVPIDDIELLEASYAKFDPSCLQEFETVIRHYPETKIVISSAWREQFSLEEIKSHFSDDVAEKIIGVTPVAKVVQKFYRHLEVLDYLKSNNLTEAAWVAIDDFVEHFPKGTPMVVTNRYRGFDKSAAEKLTTVLSQHTQRAELHRLLDLLPDQKLPAVQQFLTHLRTLEIL
jgi:predicted protein tyrosine phosphatase